MNEYTKVIIETKYNDGSTHRAEIAKNSCELRCHDVLDMCMRAMFAMEYTYSTIIESIKDLANEGDVV